LSLLKRARPAERILLFSTDPAHSLSDSLETEIGDRLVEVAHYNNAQLLAREMDAETALTRFKEEHRSTIAEIADRGTFLDQGDISELLDLSLPGMDEVMALFELSESAGSGEYARIVVDTAPSGHTSRLLQLPSLFAKWIGALDRMSDKHRFMISQVARGRTVPADEVDLFISELSTRLQRVRDVLYDSAVTSFTLVTSPEAMIVEETVRYLKLLREAQVPVTDVIVNRVEANRKGCEYCQSRASNQKPHLERIGREFASLRIHVVPALAGDVRGPEALARFAQHAWADKSDPGLAGDKDYRRSTGSRVSSKQGGESNMKQPSTSPVAGGAFVLEPKSLIIFGGKGGVGKTTAAAAAAFELARLDDSRRVLVLSIDPAHSLSDSFDEEIGESKRELGGLSNLDGMQIDAARRFEAFKDRYRDWTDELFERLTSGSRWEIQFDREAVREMVTLAPPGFDEIAALGTVSQLLENGEYTTIVLDTAPTGHLIRFLEMPGAALAWVRTFIKLLLKYKSLVPNNSIGEELIALSKGIKRVAGLLTDAEQSEFVGVTIAERMGFQETLRLVQALERLEIPMARLLINNVIPAEAAESCDFCAARRRLQQESMDAFGASFEAPLFVAPQQPREVRGPERLREHYSNWKLMIVTQPVKRTRTTKVQGGGARR
jgi:arsenite-transporting ATPase